MLFLTVSCCVFPLHVLPLILLFSLSILVYALRPKSWRHLYYRFSKSNLKSVYLIGQRIRASRIHCGRGSPITVASGMFYMAGFNIPLKRRALSELDGFVLSYLLPWEPKNPTPMTLAQDIQRLPFTPQEDSWYSFLLEAESTPGP
jgi:hypothetical protein